MRTIREHLNPEGLHRNPFFSQAVRVSAQADTLYIGGQNGVDAGGNVVGPDIASQTRQAMANLHRCLEAAGASFADVVKWTILCREGEPLDDGFAAFLEVWGERPDPPVITVAVVSGLAVPGAVVEIEAVAAVPA